MDVLKEMEADGIIRSVTRGGFISPFGYRCINTEGSAYGSVTGCRTYAIKRYIADEYLVRAAAKQDSVKLFEGVNIEKAEFDSDNKLWTLQRKDTEIVGSQLFPDVNTFKGKMLLICDGSTSYLGQKIGIVPAGSQPEAVCSHAYVKGNSHAWYSTTRMFSSRFFFRTLICFPPFVLSIRTEADGVMIFSKAVLPGYSALFRHYNDDMYL
jgi:flavin-dependent dehydrogenase